MHNQPREPQSYEDCQEESIQEFGWTSQGMDWGWGQGIKSTTHRRVEEFVYSCHQRRLTWAKKKNWTVAQWSKVLFSDESKFCISFGNQGPRVWRKGGEAHSPSCFKSSVKFPQSVMIWGAMSSAGVGPQCFLKTNVTAPVYQDILKNNFLFVTYTIIRRITSSEICALHLTHPSAHTLGAVGSRQCSARGAVGGLVPCSRVSP